VGRSLFFWKQLHPQPFTLRLSSFAHFTFNLGALGIIIFHIYKFQLCCPALLLSQSHINQSPPSMADLANDHAASAQDDYGSKADAQLSSLTEKLPVPPRPTLPPFSTQFAQILAENPSEQNKHGIQKQSLLAFSTKKLKDAYGGENIPLTSGLPSDNTTTAPVSSNSSLSSFISTTKHMESGREALSASNVQNVPELVSFRCNNIPQLPTLPDSNATIKEVIDSWHKYGYNMESWGRYFQVWSTAVRTKPTSLDFRISSIDKMTLDSMIQLYDARLKYSAAIL
jgi:hypothetical protein